MCMVRKTTATSGFFFFNWRTASMPLSSGMLTSATTTSGMSRSAASSRARPSSTMPTRS